MTNPAFAPKPSTVAPVSGDPNAVPPVSAEPYQPMASPRRFSATRSVSHSEAAESTGAQSIPEGMESSASDQVSVAKAIGMVSTAIASNNTMGETRRFRLP